VHLTKNARHESYNYQSWIFESALHPVKTERCWNFTCYKCVKPGSHCTLATKLNLTWSTLLKVDKVDRGALTLCVHWRQSRPLALWPFVSTGDKVDHWRFDPLCPLVTKSTIADESATVDLVARQCVLGVSCLVSCIFQLCGVLVII